MDENIINKYINYIQNSIYKYFEILLGKKYSKNLVKPFITKYISIRYYNDTLYLREGDFVKRFSKELNTIAKDLIKENKESEELIKNICALFGYLFYFDDCISCDDLSELINTLFSDNLITLDYEEDTKKNFKELIKEINNKKEEYNNLFKTNDFEIKLKRIKSKVYLSSIEENIEISKLYSNYAIDTAYNTGVIAEDKIYLLYILLSNQVLNNAIKLDFNTNYIVEFPETLITKHKKTIKYLKALDNDLLKSHIHLMISYESYLENKNIINNYLKEGYNFALKISESFNEDYENLILFSYLLVYDNLPSYDMIIQNKDKIKATVIGL